MKELLYALSLLVIIKGSSIYNYVFNRSEGPSVFYKTEGTMPSYTVNGIDISRYQKDIKWKKVDTTNVKFVFIKATEGIESLDPMFNYNWNEATKFGFIKGAYHFFLPDLDPKYQALNFIANVKLRKGDLPPVIDIEETRGVSEQEIKTKVLIFANLLEKAYEVKPILYSNKVFHNNFLADSIFNSYPRWIAHYEVDSLEAPSWQFWQHTDRGKVSGISEYVDLNVFNGDMAQLKSLTINK